jgi:dihydrofolate reductase
MTTVSLIVAIGRNREIGKGNQLPWHLPADLAFFKRTTSGHTVIMGRKTYESIGRPLPNRRNIIISRNKDYVAEGCEVFTSLQDALIACQGETEIFIMGGAQIYEQALAIADKLYITEVDTEVIGADAFFPQWDKNIWQEASREAHKADEKNSFDYAFVIFTK